LVWINLLFKYIFETFSYNGIINNLFFFQFTVIYLIYLIYITVSLYFSLFYVFLSFFVLGLFLAFFNFELFTAFLWLTECVIVFITILLLFYLNVFENKNMINFSFLSFKNLGLFLSFLIFIPFWFHFYEKETINYEFIKLNHIFDDFYEALSNSLLNDLFSFFFTYYNNNSFELLLLVFLLLIGSVLCVCLNKSSTNSKLNNFYDFFLIFDFFNDFITHSLMKKQNLVDQTIQFNSFRFFKKKNNTI